MARATALPETDADHNRTDRLFWTRRVSLTSRILAVNLIAIALMAGSLFYLDALREQLIEERFNLARSEAEISADALSEASLLQRPFVMVRIGTKHNLRLRLYDRKDALLLDSFELAPPSYKLIDPATEPWVQTWARWLDRGVDYLVSEPDVEGYSDPEQPGGRLWPEIAQAYNTGKSAVRLRYAPDRTPVITAAAPLATRGEVVLVSRNARDITQLIRDARQTLGIIIAVALLLTIQLSLFLARTIVQPLRSLVRAAIRVRLGRDREVVVPRLPERGDEIGLLARAFSDMTAALHQRIDAVESFAADVSHEIKNPLASLRSALESLSRVEDAESREQLMAIATHDVRRIDRLISEIAEASRIDAELSRARFGPVDLVDLARQIVADADSHNRALSANDEDAARPVLAANVASLIVTGDAAGLVRAIEKLVDNAISFSPAGSTVTIAIRAERGSEGQRVAVLEVIDSGPGVPAEDRERVFERFHSVRPENEDFGAHSGLGLAIARSIVEAHDGTLVLDRRIDRRPGARLVMTLPALSAGPAL